MMINRTKYFDELLLYYHNFLYFKSKFKNYQLFWIISLFIVFICLLYSPMSFPNVWMCSIFKRSQWMSNFNMLRQSKQKRVPPQMRLLIPLLDTFYGFTDRTKICGIERCPIHFPASWWTKYIAYAKIFVQLGFLKLKNGILQNSD